MNKTKNYLKFLPFAICLGSLLIYLIYTLYIKINPAVIVTDKLISNLKAYLIIALISLFIGLLIIFIEKIRNLNPNITKEEKNIKENDKKDEKIIIIKEEENNNKLNLKFDKQKKLKVISEKKKDNVIEVKVENKDLNEILKEEKEEELEEQLVLDEDKEYTFKFDGVACPSCSSVIAKDAAICPHCGILFDDEILRVLNIHSNSISKKEKKDNKVMVKLANILLTILFIILIFLVVNLLVNKASENKHNLVPNLLIEKQK